MTAAPSRVLWNDPLAVGVLLVVSAVEPHVPVEGGNILELAAADCALYRTIGGRRDGRGCVAAFRFRGDGR